MTLQYNCHGAMEFCFSDSDKSQALSVQGKPSKLKYNLLAVYNIDNSLLGFYYATAINIIYLFLDGFRRRGSY